MPLIVEKFSSLSPLVKKILLYAAGILIVLTIMTSTSSHTKLFELMQDKLTASVKAELKLAEDARDEYKRQVEEYEDRLRELALVKLRLQEQYDKLSSKNTKLSQDLIEIRNKLEQIEKVRDIYEASKVLNDLGYSNSVATCE